MAEPNLPFKRGQTYFGGAPADSGDGAGILGQEFTFVDDTHGTKRMVTLRAVRNSAGVTVYPKRLVILNALGTAITGTAATDSATRIAPVDEKLSASAGCAANDICFVVVKGLALCKTQLANDTQNVIAAGDLVAAQTINAATTAGTTVGRVRSRALTSSVTVATTERDCIFGKAVSAVATSNVTDTDVLVDVFGVF